MGTGARPLPGPPNQTSSTMVQVYYHYKHMMSKRASKCKVFQSRADADRWIRCMVRKYPAFQLDEIF